MNDRDQKVNELQLGYCLTFCWHYHMEIWWYGRYGMHLRNGRHSTRCSRWSENMQVVLMIIMISFLDVMEYDNH